MPLQTIKANDLYFKRENESFTGLVYSDVGSTNYAAALDGALLKRKDGKVRWFKTAEAAERALNGVRPL